MMLERKRSSHSNIVVDSKRIIGEDTPFAVLEAYRSLYTNIMYLPIESKCRKLVFTSAYPAEGKTSVSINIALTIASTSPEAKILLIDADMRSPRVPQLLGLEFEGEHGLSEYLAGIDETPNLLATKYDNLAVLTSGAENVNTPALLSSSRLAKLFDYCNDKYDYVIVDTPPVNIVTDAVLFSDHVDGFILVARADYSDVNGVTELISTLQNIDARILGITLCSLDTKRMSRYGRYGRYGRYSKYSKYSKYYTSRSNK